MTNKLFEFFDKMGELYKCKVDGITNQLKDYSDEKEYVKTPTGKPEYVLMVYGITLTGKELVGGFKDDRNAHKFICMLIESKRYIACEVEKLFLLD